jgi:uncharacterized protein YjeT (DUF2065 family)
MKYVFSPPRSRHHHPAYILSHEILRLLGAILIVVGLVFLVAYARRLPERPQAAQIINQQPQ